MSSLGHRSPERRSSAPWHSAFRFLLALVMALAVCLSGVLRRTEGQSTSTCNITYQLTTQWNVGFQVQMTIVNTGPAVSSWTIQWTFPSTQTITQLWNGVVTQTGQNVTVQNASYNGTIATGGSVTFGFNGAWSGSNPNPTSFTFNGQTCGGSAPSIITSVSALNVSQGQSAQFGVKLSAAPSSNVTVTVARVSGNTDLSVSAGSTLTFTPANFATQQTVTVSAGTAATGNADIRASAQGLTSVDVTATEISNTVPMILTSANAINVPEGGSAQYGVRLSSAPASNVTVTVARASGDTNLSVTSGGTLTFTPTNFAAQQQVTLSVPATATTVNQTAVIRASASGLANTDVTATEVAPPPIAILTDQTRTMPVLEGGSAQFGVKLASAPNTNVTVTVARLAGTTDLSVTGGATLTFTPANFNTFQEVTIGAAKNMGIVNETAVFQASGPNLTSTTVNVLQFDTDGTPIDQRTFIAALNGASEVPPTTSTATGSATIVLSPDETAALVSLSFSNLSSPETAAHVHGPADPGNSAPGALLDLDQPLGQVSNLLWIFQPTAGLQPADIVTALKSGRLYSNVHTANLPSGEIRGWFFAPSSGGGGGGGTSGGPSDFARFLDEATFGATSADLAHAQAIGFDAWLTEQFNAQASNYNNLVQLQAGTFVSYPVKLRFFQNAMTGQDQLRQRMAFALSQILVAADVGNKDGTGDPTAMVSQYHNILINNAFGNYRTLLRQIANSPIMGTFLTLVNSAKRDPAANTQPNENFIRELWQLFSIGTFKLNLDGSAQLDASGRPLETYTIAEIQEGARALTGWVYAPGTGQASMPPNPFNPFLPMIPNEAAHDTGSKTVLNGAVIPAGQTTTQDLDSIIDNVFNHPNVGPFISRQLIQQFVTSNPSPAYIMRVAQVFNNDGTGVRGNLQAVIRAILLDPEARGDAKTDASYGKLREPALFLTHLFRSLNCTGAMWGIAQRSRAMGENVFSAPDVFNFYQPDFRVVVNGQAIFAPPAEILNATTIIQRLNLLNDLLFGNIQAGGDPNPTGSDTSTVVLNFAPWDQLASNPASLVDGLNQALMHGSMSATMRQDVINAVTSVGSNNHQRAQTAIYIIAASMQYQVQR